MNYELDSELQELLLCEEFEKLNQAVIRAQLLELADKIARTRSKKQPNYL